MDGTIEVDDSFLQGCCPVSFDIGGSMTKLLYATKENGKTLLHLKSYPGGDYCKLVEKLQEILSNIKTKDPLCVCVTGIGSNLHKRRLERDINIRCNVLCEWDCFATSLLFVGKHFSNEETFYTIPEDVRASIKRQYKDFQSLVTARSPHTNTRHRAVNCPKDLVEDVSGNPEEIAQTGNIKLPCVLAMCGSAFVLLKIDEKERCQFVDYSDFGGMYFNVLGRLVTDSKDYGRLLDLAAERDGSTADVHTTELRDESTEPDWYSLLPRDHVGFPLGAVLEKPRDQIQDGDILHSLLSLLCGNMAQLVQLNATNLAVRNVYFCGNFILSDEVRTMLSQNLYRRRFGRPKNEWVNVHFVKNGGFFGALGSMILSKDILTSQ